MFKSLFYGSYLPLNDFCILYHTVIWGGKNGGCTKEMKIQKAPSGIFRSRYPWIDSFTNKPVVQCDVWAVKTTFAYNSK